MAETRTYTFRVSRKPNPSKGTRPNQGAHLLRLRQNAGLTQIQLASALGVANATIANWEWSEKPPKANLLPTLADVLGVEIKDILNQTKRSPAKRSGPMSEMQKTFDEVRELPRGQQKQIVRIIRALINEHKRAAG